MRKLFIGMLIVAAVFGGAYVWFNAKYPSYSWNQKITVVVETPSGDVSGDAVSWVQWRDGPALLPDPPHVTSRLIGEGTVVDLGDGRFLFALIKGAEYRALRTFHTGKFPTSTNSMIELAERVPSHHGEKAAFAPGNHPLLVTFEDINDPASVKRVDPENLAATFGQGYALKSITLEITDEPVTSGKVEKVLGWLRDIKGRIKPTDKKFADELTPEEQLYALDFIRRS